MLIVLDFDGVLNNYAETLVKRQGLTPVLTDPVEIVKYNLDVYNVRNLGLLVQALPNHKIIISSNWRKNHDLENIKKALNEMCFTPLNVVGATPVMLYRDQEIKAWINQNNYQGPLVVLDDHVVFNIGDELKDNEFLIDPRTGLTYLDVENLINKLNPAFKLPVIPF